MNRISKILLLAVAIFAYVHTANAQTYGNEWINYNQSYAKFTLHENGMYRISRAELVNAGITNPNGANLQVFREGAQIPIFVSVSATFGGNDYIEFYGEKADGKIDEKLFVDPTKQMNKSQNLISDTTYYFVTQSTAGPYNRYTQGSNNISGSPVKEAYVWDVINLNFRNGFSNGPSYIGETDIPIHYNSSSQFEQAEGWVNAFSTDSISISLNLNSAYKGAGSPNVQLKTTVAGFSYLATHRVTLKANNVQLADESFPKFSAKDYNVNFASNLLPSANQLNLVYTPLNSQPQFFLFDRVGVANINARFARTVDFGGLDAKYFELDPKSGGYYLEIDNFSGGATAPYLYDLDAKIFYEADVAVTNRLRFLIPANANLKRCFVVSRQSSALKNVSTIKAVSFKNYSLAANQGDYIILSHPHYYNAGGTNFVEEYRKFRSSAVGGSYTAIVANVDDLYNEFGYGYPFHAQGIRNFLNYSHTSTGWSAKSKFAFLIGKGILYPSYLSYTVLRNAQPNDYPYVPIPTFGTPAADIMLTDFNNDNIPELPIGRISILNGAQLEAYYNKAVLHETNWRSTGNQYADEVLWRKDILHVSGGKNASENAQILSPLNWQADLMSDTSVGASIQTFAKSSTAAIQVEDTEEITRRINEGVGFVQFFGHGSSSTVDFGGFDNPIDYKPNNRFPVFMANGCGVGNVFSIGAAKTLSEAWMEVPNRGSIGFIANSNVGYLYYLGTYTDSLYKQFAHYRYGATIGEQFIGNVADMFSNPNNLAQNVTRIHAEHILLQGDPAITMFGPEKPDYAVEEKYTKIKQISITTQQDSFDVQLIVFNLGKHTRDSLNLMVTRVMPNNTNEVLINKRYNGLAYTDTLEFRVAVGGKSALGVNTLKIKIDNLGEIDEVAEYNNEINKKFSVYNDDLEPIYPYEFSIVTNPDITLKGSTLNPFLESRQYVIQIDSSELFNSPVLQTTKINSKGGVVKWKPTISYVDSVVYYWRTAMDTLYGNTTHRWTPSSFVYLPNSTPGWNQSHYFQYEKDNFVDMEQDSVLRDLRFTSKSAIKTMQVQNVCLEGPNPFRYVFADYYTKINGATFYTDGCDPWPGYESLQFVLIDTITGLPLLNKIDPVTGGGMYGSFKPCRIEPSPGSGVYEDPFFEFSFINAASRQVVMNFIDSIPDGVYFMMQPRLCIGVFCGGINTTFINNWKADTASLGSGNSLYHKIRDLGFTEIDSFTKNRPMIFFMQKGNPLSVKQTVGADSTIKLYEEFPFVTAVYEGNLASNKIGPAKQWNDFKRQGISLDNGLPGDSVSVEIYGINKQNAETLLATVFGDTALNFIDAAVYPHLRLVMHQEDNAFSTPEQIKYWRVHYTPVPEAALNPILHYSFIDSLGQGQNGQIRVAIENLTDLPMDSMLVKYSLIDKNTNEFVLGTKRYKPLAALDTLIAHFDFDSKPYGGDYIFKVEANPNNDQIEQYHPNNLGFKELSIKTDNENPLLDVTFDGIHILNRDLVSAKPNILITLKDENNFLALDDTTLLQVSLRYPENPNVDVPISYADQNMAFIPADPGKDGENKARIEFRPTFLRDGIYELVVKAKDKMGNQTGNVDYKIAFSIVTKSSITSILNYPNPFSTQTQFVFTLTGSEIPEQFKIQIFSVTGKVVREISKAEIGNIHIGRNITDFTWKGDDQYGELLGNGVYLYRVVTRLNGEVMDKAENDAAGQWTHKKGFGKMYIMR